MEIKGVTFNLHIPKNLQKSENVMFLFCSIRDTNESISSLLKLNFNLLSSYILSQQTPIKNPVFAPSYVCMCICSRGYYLLSFSDCVNRLRLSCDGNAKSQGVSPFIHFLFWSRPRSTLPVLTDTRLPRDWWNLFLTFPWCIPYAVVFSIRDGKIFWSSFTFFPKQTEKIHFAAIAWKKIILQ